jgi:hypothetical protein
MKFEVTNPNDIKLKITHELTLYEWSSILKELNTGNYPSMHFARDVQSVIDQANAHFYPVKNT